MPRSNAYWKKRLEAIAYNQNTKADKYIEDLEKQYKKALSSIKRDLERFYARYANAEGVDMHTARKQLSDAEKETWEVTLEEYRKMALNEELRDQMESMYSKSRVSRLEAIQSQIRVQLEKLYSELDTGLEVLLAETFTDTYYQTIYEVQRGIGIGVNFAIYNQDAVDKIISKPWKWGHFSDTVWNNKTMLMDELEIALSQAFIRGDSLDKVIKMFDKRMNVGYSRAANVIQTEHAYIAGEATSKGYEETGVEEYEYLATLDLKTSKVCRDMDGEVLKLSEKVVWLNYPPLHCRCRSTTIPHFSDIIIYRERIARGADGKTYYVPDTMKYHEWYDKYVKNNPEERIAEKKHQNRHADKKQHEQYRKMLGKEVPRSLEEYQDLKYTNSNRWSEVKNLYKDVKWQVKAQENLKVGSVHKVPFEAEPNSVFDKYEAGRLTTRRYYGNTGKPRVDIDLTDHGNPKQHKIMPHQHNWLKDELNHDDIQRPKDLPLTKAQTIANKDILKGMG